MLPGRSGGVEERTLACEFLELCLIICCNKNRVVILYECKSLTFDPTELRVSRDPYWEPCTDVSELSLPRGISATGLLCPSNGVPSCDPESY